MVYYAWIWVGLSSHRDRKEQESIYTLAKVRRTKASFQPAYVGIGRVLCLVKTVSRQTGQTGADLTTRSNS